MFSSQVVHVSLYLSFLKYTWSVVLQGHVPSSLSNTRYYKSSVWSTESLLPHRRLTISFTNTTLSNLYVGPSRLRSLLFRILLKTTCEPSIYLGVTERVEYIPRTSQKNLLSYLPRYTIRNTEESRLQLWICRSLTVSCHNYSCRLPLLNPLRKGIFLSDTSIHT